MFNIKLKKQIASLEDRIWQLENPPKYKVGDKIKKEWIVNTVRFVPFKEMTWTTWSTGRYYLYTLTNIKTGETKTI